VKELGALVFCDNRFPAQKLAWFLFPFSDFRRFLGTCLPRRPLGSSFWKKRFLGCFVRSRSSLEGGHGEEEKTYVKRHAKQR
jgi:hypothetical protein